MAPIAVSVVDPGVTETDVGTGWVGGIVSPHAIRSVMMPATSQRITGDGALRRDEFDESDTADTCRMGPPPVLPPLGFDCTTHPAHPGGLRGAGPPVTRNVE